MELARRGDRRTFRARPQEESMATAKKSTAKKGSAKSSAKKSAAKKPAAGARAAKTDATVLLQRDHADVKKLFRQYEKLADSEADGQERQALAMQICQMLTVHATIEEEIFYPAAREAEVEEDLLDEAEVEHASAKDLIAQIQSMSPEDELYDAKVTVLGEYVDHHVQEEEGQMFPKCRRAKMDLAGLAEQLAERKSELMAEEPA
jgi:hemerythrin superfamily protein